MLICPSGPGPRRVHNVTEEAGFPLPPLEPPSPPHPWRVSHQRSLRTNIPPVPNYLGGIGRSLTLRPSCNRSAESSPTVNLSPIQATYSCAGVAPFRALPQVTLHGEGLLTSSVGEKCSFEPYSRCSLSLVPSFIMHFEISSQIGL